MTKTTPPTTDIEKQSLKESMKRCEALEGCKNIVRYTIADHELKKSINLCEGHFKQGIRAWLEEDPIIQKLMQEGIL